MHRSWYTIPFSVSWSWCQLPAAVSCTSLSTPASLHHDTPFPAASPFPAFSARTHIINVLNIFAIHMPKWICSYEVNNITAAGKLPYIFLANHSSDKNELLNILHQIFSVRYLNAARYEKKKINECSNQHFFFSIWNSASQNIHITYYRATQMTGLLWNDLEGWNTVQLNNYTGCCWKLYLFSYLLSLQLQNPLLLIGVVDNVLPPHQQLALHGLRTMNWLSHKPDAFVKSICFQHWKQTNCWTFNIFYWSCKFAAWIECETK